MDIAIDGCQRPIMRLAIAVLPPLPLQRRHFHYAYRAIMHIAMRRSPPLATHLDGIALGRALMITH